MHLPFPDSLPAPHRAFLRSALDVLPQDPRLLGIAAAGSCLTGNMDRFSDLDLIIVTEPDRQTEVLQDRVAIARKLGTWLAGFTGEHVGEPRLLISLYGPPLLHVDLKFVSLTDAHVRVEEPCVLWQRDERVSAALAQGQGIYPQPDIAWIEDRIWIWAHYGATKIGRGELFEAIDMINYLRATVLGPLALCRAGARPQGVRRLESADPEFAAELQRTLPGTTRTGCLQALNASLDLYRQLRKGYPEDTRNAAAEAAVLAYLAEIAASVSNQFVKPDRQTPPYPSSPRARPRR